MVANTHAILGCSSPVPVGLMDASQVLYVSTLGGKGLNNHRAKASIWSLDNCFYSAGSVQGFLGWGVGDGVLQGASDNREETKPPSGPQLSDGVDHAFGAQFRFPTLCF